ncbi:MAG: MFS transporter [Promethearchaeota archaeon]
MSKLDIMAKEKGEKGKVVRSKRYILGLTLFMGGVALLDQFCSLVEGPLMPYMLKDFGISAAEFALWQGIYGIICFSVFFIAWAFDRIGRKKGILILMITLGVPAGLIIIPMPFHLFMIVYAIVIMGTLSNTWELPITEEAPAEKRATYGGIAFLIGLVPLYAFIASPIAESLGWRWAYGIMFFWMLFLLIPLYFMKETQRWKDTQEEHGHEVLKIKTALKSLKRKDLQYVAISTIVYTLWTITFKLVSTWGGYFYMDIVGYTSGEYRSILTVGGLLTMVGAILSGLLMDKLGRIGTLIIGCVGSSIAFLGLGMTKLPVFFWMGYLCMPIILGWVMIYFNEIFPTRIRATANGITNTLSRAGYVVGPLIASALLILFPDMVGFWITGGLLILIPLFSLFIKPYETKGQELETIQEKR